MKVADIKIHIFQYFDLFNVSLLIPCFTLPLVRYKFFRLVNVPSTQFLLSVSEDFHSLRFFRSSGSLFQLSTVLCTNLYFSGLFLRIVLPGRALLRLANYGSICKLQILASYEKISVLTVFNYVGLVHPLVLTLRASMFSLFFCFYSVAEPIPQESKLFFLTGTRTVMHSGFGTGFVPGSNRKYTNFKKSKIIGQLAGKNAASSIEKARFCIHCCC